MILVYRQQDEQKRIREAARSSTMKNLAALLCMISALLVSVFSYKCYSCFSRNSTTYDESEIECLGDRCMTASQYYNLNGEIYKSLYKGCANETMCGAKGSAIVEKTKFDFLTHCCTGDLCNNQVYEPPEDNQTLNGKKCPFSICANTLKECKTGKEINCTGSMDRCIDYRATLKIQSRTETNYSGKGCANTDCCRFNFDSNIGLEETHREYLTC